MKTWVVILLVIFGLSFVIFSIFSCKFSGTEGEKRTSKGFLHGMPTIKEGMVINEKRNGIWVELYLNGDTASTTHYIKGVKTGKSVTYYPNGQMSTSKQYLNDLLVGLLQMWFDSGLLLGETYFNTSGEKSGSYKEFWSSGHLKVSGQYYNDLEHGRWLYSDSTGTLQKTIVFPDSTVYQGIINNIDDWMIDTVYHDNERQN